jgi:sarcosine oxidase subunit gamma
LVSGLLADQFKVGLPDPGRFARSGETAVAWADSRSWWVENGFLGADECRGLTEEIGPLLWQAAAVLDRSHGFVSIRIAGPAAKHVLAKGCALDLHPAVFVVGDCAVTQIAQVRVHLRLVAEDNFLLLSPRSYAENLLTWLDRTAGS